jgi:formylglycine-generating enzyme required for sulfatase activity
MTRTHETLARPLAALAASVVLASGVWPCASPLSAQTTAPAEHAMHRVPAARFVPFYSGSTGQPVDVAAFDMDEEPVTNAQYLAFVTAHARWQRTRAPRLFVDPQYLSQWTGDTELGPAARPTQPVTFVSWYASRAYCQAQGERLPTEAEWELAARADAHQADAHRDRAFVDRILAFYTRPHGALGDVGGAPNLFGLRDLHGLIWEWVDDFNASMVSVDDRARGDAQTSRFCGGASLGAEDVADYAAFMRYAFRSSLRASYTVHNLGFRCVRSADAEHAP